MGPSARPGPNLFTVQPTTMIEDKGITTAQSRGDITPAAESATASTL